MKIWGKKSINYTSPWTQDSSCFRSLHLNIINTHSDMVNVTKDTPSSYISRLSK